jgi:para-nitrobenzyl esterase
MKIFLSLSIAFFCTSLLLAAPNRETTESQRQVTEPAYVTITTGPIMGSRIDGVYTFLGIPYAKAERFEMPVAYPAWQDTRPALAYGEVCPIARETGNPREYMTPSGSMNTPNEMCQFINVWSPSLDRSAKKAVLVYIHGGQWTEGSSNELSTFEGASLVKSGDIIFVSLNHRLNIYGFTDLSGFGEQYKYSGNASLADIIFALQWIQDNITVFGGDKNNVTILGQSGGGWKVLTLMGIPRAQGLFHKAVSISDVNSTGNPIDQKTARENGAKVIANVKAKYSVTSDADALRILKSLNDKDFRAVTDGTGVGNGPEIDNDFYSGTLFESGNNDNSYIFTDMAQNIPLMVTGTFAEMNGNMRYMTLTAPIPSYLTNPDRRKVSESDVLAAIQARYGREKADKVETAFRKAYPTHDLFDVQFMSFFGSIPADHNALRAKAAQTAPVYAGVFAWNWPIFGGITAGHTGGDIPIIFNNMDKMNYMIYGDEAAAYKVAREASTALCNFAKTGNPGQSGLSWPVFTLDEGAAMIFDAKSEVRYYHDRDLYAAFALPDNP